MSSPSKYKDLIKTIDEDEDVECFSEESDGEVEFQPSKQKSKQKVDFNTDFQFVSTTEEYNKDPWDDLAKYVKRKPKTKTDEKIKRVRAAIDEDKDAEIEDESKKDEQDEDAELSLSEDELKHDKIKEKKKKKRKKGAVDDENVEVPKNFFEDVFLDTSDTVTFCEMNLSKPLVRAINQMNFVHPTPIQAATIPIVMEGRDVCGCAATGTGKTAAYMLPTLERLLYRPAGGPAVTRVLVLVPTRELGVQVYQVTRQLAQHSDLSVALAVGGLDLKAQERELRTNPDIVIATPGRLIDHLHGTPTFSLEAVEVLILDEADRMLDEHFAEQLGEVVRRCSRQRQTLLFSATMTDAVERLAAVSLKSPVRVRVDGTLALRQELVRVRREAEREAALCALVCRTFREACVVFVQTRRQAHRLRLALALLGVRVSELHGDLPQPARLDALQRFRDGVVDVLVATDVAARGLDIPGVRSVVNFVMPATLEHYVHRVGRTARAGRAGVAVSLAGEGERRLVKEVVKEAKTPLKVRLIPADILAKYKDKLEKLEPKIAQILEEEKEERLLSKAENQANRADKILKGETEAKRPWFQTKKERQAEKDRLKLTGTKDVNTNKTTKGHKNKHRKETPEDRVNNELNKVVLLQAKMAKKKHKQKKISAVVDEGVAAKKSLKRKRSNFADDLCDTSAKKAKFLRHETKNNGAGPKGKHPTSRGKRGAGKGKDKGKGKGKAFGKPQAKRNGKK